MKRVYDTLRLSIRENRNTQHLPQRVGFLTKVADNNNRVDIRRLLDWLRAATHHQCR